MISFVRTIVKFLNTILKYSKIVGVCTDILEYSSKRFEEFSNTLKEESKEEKPNEKTQENAQESIR